MTRLLEANGERVHPLSARLASGSRHIELESGSTTWMRPGIRRHERGADRELHGFPDAVDEGDYDLVIADEAWDIDHYWHEHPELKKAGDAWFTDFVGYVPMPSGGEHEAFLTTDYNAEMIEHIERHPGVRDRAIFVGNPKISSRCRSDGTCRRCPTGCHGISISPATSSANTRMPSAAARSFARVSATGRTRRLHRHGRRIRRRRSSDQAHSAELSAGTRQAARVAHDRRGRPAHRSRLARRA